MHALGLISVLSFVGEEYSNWTLILPCSCKVQLLVENILASIHRSTIIITGLVWLSSENNTETMGTIKHYYVASFFVHAFGVGDILATKSGTSEQPDSPGNVRSPCGAGCQILTAMFSKDVGAERARVFGHPRLAASSAHGCTTWRPALLCLLCPHRRQNGPRSGHLHPLLGRKPHSLHAQPIQPRPCRTRSLINSTITYKCNKYITPRASYPVYA